MRLLVDENLSIRIAARLGDAGHDAVHVTTVGLGSPTMP
jgi:predicted nuclease of predicted toxin-antitoxin system